MNVPEKRVRELFPEAEGAEVLHLDLKPDNVMVEERKDGTFFLIDKSNLIIIDFGSGGVAGVANGHANELYTAPERLLDKTHRPPPDRTWDIFSLGAILYYLCTGKDPMSAKGCTRGEWTRYVLSIDLRDSKDQRGADLTLICRKCLAFDSKDRYSSPGLLEEDLQAWLTDHPIPNVGRTYKWWELERLLIRRCGKDDDIIDATRFTGRGGQDDDIIDASQFAGRVCLLLAMSMVLAATIHTWMVYSGGYTPSDSYFGTSLLACGLSTAFLLGFGWAIHWRFAYFRLFLPLMAGVVGIHLIFSFDGQIDSLYKPPKLSHLKEAYPYAVILVAVTVFIIGSSEKRWSAMKYLGVASFILALFSYQLANNETFVNYLPVPIVAHEATIATLFGLSLMKVSAQKSDDKPKSSLEKM